MARRLEENAGLGMESFSYVVIQKATEPELEVGEVTTPVSLLRTLVSGSSIQPRERLIMRRGVVLTIHQRTNTTTL